MNDWIEKALIILDQTSKNGDRAACLELANHYHEKGRPLAALAYAKKANRLGYKMELGPLEAEVHATRENEWDKDPIGAYKLGCELGSYSTDRTELYRAVSYLKTAVNSGSTQIVGPAALFAADLLRSLAPESSEAYQFYKIANEAGFPDLLPPAPKLNKAGQ